MVRRHTHAQGIVVGVAVAMLVFLMLAVAAAAGATKPAKPAKHKFTGTVLAAVVGTSGNSNTVAGSFNGTLGSGAVVYKTTPAGTNLAATFKAFTERGSFRGTTLVTPTAQPDGSTTFAGKLQITGGTVLYHGAKAKDVAVTGSLNPQTNVLTFQVKGTVTY